MTAPSLPTILDTIVTHKRIEVDSRKAARPASDLLAELRNAPPLRDFAAALCEGSKPAPRVIAEIKRHSPSKGVLREGIDPAQIAAIYEANGAAAISVLCDSRFFGGSLDDLRAVRAVSGLPLLCKEFIVDRYQIVEARLAGADAVLLLASVLPTVELREARELCDSLGMAALVEVHDAAEVASALKAGARIIGINNRDLRNFHVDTNTTAELLPLLPKGMIMISESGIRNAEDRDRMSTLGVDAILVGEGLIAADNIASATREICGLNGSR